MPEPDDPISAAASGRAPEPVGPDTGWSQPVVGVMGGLGPMATALFCAMVTRLTPATRDQDHLDMVVLSHSTTPDRTAHILDAQAPDPLPVMAADAARLQALGAAFIVMPCNTGHWFMESVEQAVRVPVLSIVDATVQAALARAADRFRHHGRPRIGVLATDGSRSVGVYTRALEAAGAEPVYPDDAGQARLMQVIYDQVKAGRPSDGALFASVVEPLANGVDAIILGCTELAIVRDEQHLESDQRLVDSLDSLARVTLVRAGRVPLTTPHPSRGQVAGR